MNLTIRERCQKVAESLKNKGAASIESIARATGLSKHLCSQAFTGNCRAQISTRESEFWETKTGSDWLKLMVISVVYYFGVKEGIGCEKLSEFLSVIRLGEHVGISRACNQKLEKSDQARHY